MEFLSLQLEATSDVEIPVRSWEKVTLAADKVVGLLWDSGRVSLRIITPASMRALNKQFRGNDADTDVLSFPANENNGYLGDIALNWTAVCTQAKNNSSCPDCEAVALITHGLLHLAGYKHETDQEDSVMTNKTISLCNQAGFEVGSFGH